MRSTMFTKVFFTIFALLPLGVFSEHTMTVKSISETEAILEISDTTGADVPLKLAPDRIPTGYILPENDKVAFGPYAEEVAKKHEIKVTGLTPATSYTFMVVTLNDQGRSIEVASPSTGTCTKPLPVTEVKVDESGTTSTAIKITWTKPDVDPDKVTVVFDGYETLLDDPAVEEYTLTLSAANTPLTAGQSGKCKVVTGVISSDCGSATNEQEIDCATTGAPSSGKSSGDESSAAELLPGAVLIISLLYKILVA